MADTKRIDHLLKALKEVNGMFIRHTVPLTIEEKTALLSAHSDSWNTIMHYIPVERKCASCEHCVLWEGKHCCAARDMRPIPFEIENNVGGCSKWSEADYIPFN